MKAMSIFNQNSIGEVYTPSIWARWLLEHWRVFDAWLNGAFVCDPTAGKGVFILELFEIAKDRNIAITPEMVARIGAYDINKNSIEHLKNTSYEKFHITLHEDMVYHADIVLSPPNPKFDILIGNPPWVNFADLPAEYKSFIKPYFIQENLVIDKKKLLLGSSRIDIAALILKVALGRLLRDYGRAYFFVPLSLFCGDDAHAGFRNYLANGHNFAVTEVFEFSQTKVFSGISASYCCAAFASDCEQVFPVTYYREKTKTQWEKRFAVPLCAPNDPWRICIDESASTKAIPHISLAKEQSPRQGINTCGANDIYIFTEKPDYIPEKFLFPLVTKETLKQYPPVPQKWICVPHDLTTGKPISLIEIKKYPSLYKYLKHSECFLTARKGTLIQTWIKKGFWWALFGVGAYAFAPYKVIWEAYGKRTFLPCIVDAFNGQPWQANQAMQAYIPCYSMKEARSLLDVLQATKIQTLLSELNGEGKCNWAQPGKIKKILNGTQKNAVQARLL